MKKFISAITLASIAFAIAITPVFAQTDTGTVPPPPPAGNTATTTRTVKPHFVKNKTVDLACVAAAVAKREAAIGTAFSTFSTAAQAALSARATALSAAWAMTDKTARRSAIKAAWRAYTTAIKASRKDLNTARHNAWAGFRTDTKACGPAATADEPASEGSDANL